MIVFIHGIMVCVIVMGIIFILVVTPTAIFMRAINKDSLKKKYNKSKKTYWIERDKTINSMKKQF